MMSINEIKAKKELAGPGMWTFDAEATVDVDGKEVFVHVNWYDNFKHYTVSEESLWNQFEADSKEESIETPFVGDPDFEGKLEKFCCDAEANEYLEAYERLAQTKVSAYSKVFALLDGMLKKIGEDIA